MVCIDHKNQPNVDKYTRPMDPMGIIGQFAQESNISWPGPSCMPAVRRSCFFV